MSRGRVSSTVRKRIRLRAAGRCEYCRTPDDVQLGGFHCDHCVPERLGGPTRLANLAWACPRCNGLKLAHTHAIDLQTGERVPVYNPRIMAWLDHFEWPDDGLTIAGRTPIGRATVTLLEFNAPKFVQIRRLLRRGGLRPDKEA